MVIIRFTSHITHVFWSDPAHVLETQHQKCVKIKNKIPSIHGNSNKKDWEDHGKPMVFVTTNSRICSLRTDIYTTPDSYYVHVYGTYHSAYCCCSVGGCGFHPFPFGSLEPHSDDLSENRYIDHSMG